MATTCLFPLLANRILANPDIGQMILLPDGRDIGRSLLDRGDRHG